MAQPEKLNLWDRFFNRYRKEIIKQDSERWERRPYLEYFDANTKFKYTRNFVTYKITDRLTGSEKIEKEYLD